MSIPQGRVWSPHWSGWMTYGSHITKVSTTLVVPTMATTNAAGQMASMWVGIDGFYSHQLLQAGVTEVSTPLGPEVFPWFEQLPQQPTASTVPMTVAQGQRVQVRLQQWIPGIWCVSMTNLDTGASWHTGVLYNGPLETADWVLEPPQSAGQPTQLPPLATPASFSDLAMHGQAFVNFAVDMGEFPQTEVAPGPLSVSGFTVSHP